MTNGTVRIHGEADSPFDAIRRTRPDGSEFWSGRELRPLLGYDTWQRFRDAIERARIACVNSGQDARQHFSSAANNPSELGGRPAEDVRLTRYAAYLVAMNGDPRKPEIAEAQTYFAIKTREAEVRSGGRHADLDVIRAMVDSIEQTRTEQARQAAVLAVVSERAENTAARVEALEGNYGRITALAYAKLNGLRDGVDYLNHLGRAAAAIARRDGVPVEKAHSTIFGTVNAWPVEIWDEALAQVGE